MSCDCKQAAKTTSIDSSSAKQSTDYLDPLYIYSNEEGDMVFYSLEDLNEFLNETDALQDSSVMLLKAGCVSRLKIRVTE